MDPIVDHLVSLKTFTHILFTPLKPGYFGSITELYNGCDGTWLISHHTYIYVEPAIVNNIKVEYLSA